MTNRRRRPHPCAARGIHIERCGPMGKISYRTEAAANAALDVAHEAAVDDPRRREARCYPCRYGDHWHLTSEDVRPRRRTVRT